MIDKPWFLNLITCVAITMVMATPVAIFALKVKYKKFKATKKAEAAKLAFKNRNRLVY